ncbi:RNA polymerase sigma-70 factor, ECF subfamily [Alloactinosynnema sp. L-07]|uniref:RNA polymerase sigma factor n=1 Tax=Alloactinosynnema sp. L-07 TaxID=1653480 RepID=UPI00065F07A7|nr:sigma-70 family RNA polymerase sigma factor [Alloactinosynnema sp. L-07]CRK56259.1 RNA polymerase sigma-70 factor, ECF subfamily [Alloactinosynnema sp. L-07]
MNEPTEDLLRTLAPQVLGVVVRRHGDFAAAEDAVQEALIAATAQWVDGVPDNPRGWLIQVATRRMVDAWRSDEARRLREERASREPPPGETADQDDTLALLFLCCHPSLTPASAIALTLRAIGGLTTAEIANAFLVPEATMAQRISRAKQKVKGLPFTPSADLAPVLHVLYLMFNEGYASSTGPTLVRTDLSGEAIRLTRATRAAVPDHAELGGLLALMLLTDARRPARTAADGTLIPLAEQDRSTWDHALIAEGSALITDVIARGAVGPYQLQAAIAALHGEAPDTEKTDWPQILALYGLLEQMTPNPMVTLNRAIAASMVHGPIVGLSMLESLDDQLKDHHRLHAVRAHLHERAGNLTEAAQLYRSAARHTTSLQEQRYLTAKAAELGS